MNSRIHIMCAWNCSHEDSDSGKMSRVISDGKSWNKKELHILLLSKISAVMRTWFQLLSIRELPNSLKETTCCVRIGKCDATVSSKLRLTAGNGNTAKNQNQGSTKTSNQHQFRSFSHITTETRFTCWRYTLNKETREVPSWNPLVQHTPDQPG